MRSAIKVAAFLVGALLARADAHNGSVTVAGPIGGIVIDGELSDWPTQMTRHRLTVLEGYDQPRDAADAGGEFRVGYDAENEALYVAVEVRDESAVIDTTGEMSPNRMWQIQDVCEVHVDALHLDKESPGLQFLAYGDLHGRYPFAPSLGNTQLAVRRTASDITYEWRLDLAEVASYWGLEPGQPILSVGKTLGFDVSVGDKDEDGSFSWLNWGPGINKQALTSSRGNLVLGDRDELIVHPLQEIGATSIQAIMQTSDGQIWLATWSGPVRYENGGFHPVHIDSLVTTTVLSMLEDQDGDLWFGTNGSGVVRVRDGEVVVYHGQTSWQDHVWALMQERSGAIWMGSFTGARRFDGSDFTDFTTENGLPGNYVNAIHEDRAGDVWLGTWEGLSRFDGDGFTNYTVADGLSDNRVTDIAEDGDGHLWIGTRGGLTHFDGESFSSLTLEDGLPGLKIEDVLVDDLGVVWLGLTEGGVVRYDGFVFQSLLSRHGLHGENIRYLHQDHDGVVWIVTHQGITRFRPSVRPPEIAVVNTIADREYRLASAIDLSTAHRHVTFEFAGSSIKTDVADMAYAYRLLGREAIWQLTRESRVAYADLERGDYVFEVRAIDRDLAYSESPARVAVTMHWPYERIGLWSALAISVLLIVWQIGRILQRDRQILLANQELKAANQQIREATTRKSRFLASMSHELRTPMNSIIGFTQLVLRHTGSDIDGRQRENLGKVLRSADHLLRLISDLLDLSKIEAGRMEVRAEAFDVVDLVEECAAEVAPLVPEQVTLTTEVSSGICRVHTDRGRLRQILVNLLSNALKFTTSGEVRLRVQRGGLEGHQCLVLFVTDTGAGIPSDALGTIFEEFRQVRGTDPTGRGTGLGLPIAKGNAELLGGRIDVQSELGRGSTFTVTVPLVYRDSEAAQLGQEGPPDVPPVEITQQVVDGRAVEQPDAGDERPSAEQVLKLVESARRGQILVVRQEIDAMAQRHEELSQLACRLRYHTDRFELDRICDLLSHPSR